MTSDPPPRVIITSDPSPQTMTSDPPPLMVTSDPPRQVYTEPKTPVRPSASPRQLSLAAVVRCPAAVETNMAVNASDCVVSAGIDSKQHRKTTPASTPRRHPPVTSSHVTPSRVAFSPVTPSQSPASNVLSSPFDLEKHMARIQMFTKSPGGEFSYPGRPMFGDFPPSGGEEHEPLFVGGGGDGPGNVFANNISSKFILHSSSSNVVFKLTAIFYWIHKQE
ncbi:hypothetical protein NP493_989g02019 [Ridgeia piscesae]|uniref:Uncharacterized protein n=1 Tax=Ridgeia piscesae TaxID=27915 RepID=A0AAD9KJ74_RIDPI|nr:hypothetical protein NP493_989g02019 [Ridgeia piscesae]